MWSGDAAPTIAAPRRQRVLGAPVEAPDGVARHALDAMVVGGTEVTTMPVIAHVSRNVVVMHHVMVHRGRAEMDLRNEDEAREDAHMAAEG
jgi:hypothetical protein